MRELTDLLEREAGRLHPRPDLDDVLRRAGRRRRRGRMAVAALVVAVAGLVGLVVQLPGGGQQVATTVAAPVPVDLATVGGPSIAAAGPDLSYAAFTLERVDQEAAAGAWTVVVRRPGGTLGEGSAAVTYPVSAPPSADGRLVVSDFQGVHRARLVRDVGPGRVEVAAAGLSDRDVTTLADNVDIVDGRPVVADRLLTGDRAYELVAYGPDRPPVVAEARYGCDSLGESDVLGGLCYAGLSTSSGFVAALYGYAGFTPGPDLGGRPTAVSGVGGGNGTLAWEIRPGVIAYVGYSGAGMGPDQIAALHRLASRFELLSPDAWAATEPQVVEQSNGWTG